MCSPFCDTCSPCLVTLSPSKISHWESVGSVYCKVQDSKSRNLQLNSSLVVVLYCFYCMYLGDQSDRFLRGDGLCTIQFRSISSTGPINQIFPRMMASWYNLKSKIWYNAEARQLYKLLGSFTSWGNHSQWEHTLGPRKSILQTDDGLDRRQARVYCSLELDLIGNG